MAYPYRGAQSPRDDQPQYSNFSPNPLSPQRNPNRLSGGMISNSSNDARGGLTRRFTTNALPSLSPIGQQRLQAAGDQQMPTGGYSRVTSSQHRARYIEGLLEQQRRINAEIEQVAYDETRREFEGGLQHKRTITQVVAQSEPTTPPEYQDNLPTFVSRPNRYSTNSLTSPPGITGHPNRSSTLTSPAAGFALPNTTTNNANLPSQSVPGSRRQSDDEEDEDDFYFGTYDSDINRAAAKPNRNSMPVTTSYDRKRNTSEFPFAPLNTHSFLLDDDEKSSLPQKSSTKTSPPDTKTFLQVQHTADGFPKLIRREENGELVSGSSVALDLALSAAPTANQQVSDRVTGTRHRISLPPSALSSNGNIAPLNSILANASDAKSAANNRRSLEVKFTAETKRPALMASPPRNMANGFPKGISSYSTNDIPTLKNFNGETQGGVSLTSTQPNNTAEVTSPDQSTGSMTRVTSTSTSNSNRHSQELVGTSRPQESNLNIFPSAQGTLPGNTAPFGQLTSINQPQMHQMSSANMPSYGQPQYFGGYGMQMLNNGFGNMNLNGGYGGQAQFHHNQMQPYQQGGYGAFHQHHQDGQVVPGARRYGGGTTLQQRKAQAEEFFHSTQVSDLVGQIYGLCKDQHGCRFLQKKLEEDNERDIKIIFDEVKIHFTELMMDPFGNYLCQRLLESANDEQRTILVQNAAPEMTQIALNQHGTRALQRMIEFISTPEQTAAITVALQEDVVQLIQDLNGNHVIQKCLNHLSSQDAQFIFDAVGESCVIVGTHRHGCCVLQRCIDHAKAYQKGDLISQIIDHAFELVQDPFGNYVVQYILDLGEPCFTEPLCRSFLGSVADLSKQKFSSNVIEKCIRCCSPDTRRMMISEFLPVQELGRFVRDGYANYVVQTSIDFADDEMKVALIENLRPMMPDIRHTPYGRRIQAKIQDYDNDGVGLPTAIQNIVDANGGPGAAPGQQPVRNNRMGIVGAPANWGNGGGFGPLNVAAPAPQRPPQDFSFMNGNYGGGYQNSNGNYAGQNFRPNPGYGHF